MERESTSLVHIYHINWEYRYSQPLVCEQGTLPYFILTFLLWNMCLKQTYWILLVSHCISFRSTFFPPAVAEAACCHLGRTTLLLDLVIVFTATWWHAWGGPLSHSDRGDRKMNICIFIPLNLQFWDWELTPNCPQTTSLIMCPRISFPPFPVSHCSLTSLSKINCSHASHCLSSAFEEARLRYEYSTWRVGYCLIHLRVLPAPRNNFLFN